MHIYEKLQYVRGKFALHVGTSIYYQTTLKYIFQNSLEQVFLKQH